MTSNHREKTLRLISIIVGGSAYRDRMHLLYALDEHVSEHIILTRDDAGAIPHLQRTRVVKPRYRLRGPLFAMWAGIVALRIVMRSDSKEKWLVSEHFLWLGLLLPRILLPSRIATCVFLYAPMRSMFMQKAWASDPYAGKLSMGQVWHYARQYGSHMIGDMLGAFVASAFIVNSEAIRRDILKFSSRKPVLVVPTSISLPSPAPPALRQNDATRLKFLYVGSIQPSKGIGILLKAFSYFHRQNPQVELVIIGRCLPADHKWFLDLMDQYAVDNSGIEYLPHMSSEALGQYYRECDIFVFPSFHEGSPRVVKEAMIHGLPIVANDIPGIRLIDKHGQAIQYVEPGNLDDLVEHMSSLAANRDRRQKLGSLSQKIVSDFSHERIAQQLAENFIELQGFSLSNANIQ